MVRKTLIAASLALLAIGGARPSSADARFLESYGEIFGARTIIGRPNDARPKDAIHGQEDGEDARTSAFFISPFYHNRGYGGGFRRETFAGATLGYAGAIGDRNPYQIWSSLYSYNLHGPVDNRFGFDVGGKFTLWQPANENLPVVSFVGQYRDIDLFGFNRLDLLVALDQRITNNLFLTGNIGWGRGDVAGAGDVDDLIAGVGLTWRAAPRLSFSADYLIDNDVDGEDRWTLSGAYALNEDLAVRLGGGKHETFFGNVIWKFGGRRGGGAAQK